MCCVKNALLHFSQISCPELFDHTNYIIELLLKDSKITYKYNIN